MKQKKVLMIGPVDSPEHDGLLVFAQAVRELKCVAMTPARQPLGVLLELINVYKPDWVMVFGRSSLSVDALRVISTKAKIFIWDADTLNEQRRGCWKMLKGIPTIMAPSMLSTTNFCKGLAKIVAWVPSFYDNVFYAVTEPRNPAKLKYNVVFVGREGISSAEGLTRIAWCKAIQAKFGLTAYGNLPGICNREVFSHEMANVYANAKIVIDIKRVGFDYGDWDCSDRIFKAMGCGAFYLTFEIPKLELMFTPGVHLGTYNNTLEDLLAKIGYWLNHPVEREVIARKGQKEVLAKHLLHHRIEYYWRLMEKADGAETKPGRQ